MGQQKYLINMADCEISTRVLNTLLMRLPTWLIENATILFVAKAENFFKDSFLSCDTGV